MQEIAEYNEDVCPCCTHCKKAPSTVEHIRWECEAFEPDRVKADPKLAKVPRKYLADCIKCGIAPAMKVEGDKTFWGRDLDEGESEEVKKDAGSGYAIAQTGQRCEGD